MNGRVLGIVPARLASTRLPNKPLYPLLGRPLIEWVWRRVEGMKVLDEAVVATDAEEVAEVCRAMGAPVELTSPDHPSGTDGVAEVARLEKYSGYEVIANIQGDEPLLKEAHLRAAIELVRERGWEIGTCATPLMDPESRKDPSVVKVVRARSGRALYFSRSPIPYKRDEKPSAEELGREPFLRHIGIYAYRVGYLHRYGEMRPCPLEQAEQLEQLRALWYGERIHVAEASQRPGPGVDTEDDLRIVEQLLKARLNGN